MIKLLLIATAIAGTVLAAPAEWRAETGLAGTDYVGRSGPDGVLLVKGWREDGGTYVGDDLHAIAFISMPDRVGIMTNAFRLREPDGAAAWTIKAAMSVAVDRDTVYVETRCGEGRDFPSGDSQTVMVIGIASQSRLTSDGSHFTGLVAAAKVDLRSGTIEPIDPVGIYCVQEELN